jgi:hypothetical protein
LLPLAMLGLVLLAGCAGGRLGVPFGRGDAPAPLAAGPVSTDPVVTFVANARPGETGRVVLPDGRPAEVRLQRTYAAASGRECREAVVAQGQEEAPRLICGEGRSWAEARPLLRGGAGSAAVATGAGGQAQGRP